MAKNRKGFGWVWEDWDILGRFHAEKKEASTGGRLDVERARTNRASSSRAAAQRERDRAKSSATPLGEAGADVMALTDARGLPSTRFSVDESVDHLVSNLYKTYASLALRMPWELLEFLEILARWNPDFSQAVGNVRRLGNVGFDVIVEAGSDAEEKEINERIDKLLRRVNKFGGGMDGIANALFDSAMTFGSFAMEWVPNNRLDDIRDVYLVPVKTVRFAKKGDDWIPFQRAPLALARTNSDGFIELNPFTFIYKTTIQHPGSPYGVPPYLASLEPLSIQKDMTKNIKMAMKKVGLLGILDFVVKSLDRLPNEDQESYNARCGRVLQEYAKKFGEMASTGALVHFDTDATVSSLSMNAGNVAGAKSLFELNEEQAFSGLQTVPAMHGRSYSTTETYAGVLYEDMLAQVGNVRRVIGSAIEEGLLLACLLWGYKPKKIRVEWKKNSPLNRLQDAQAREIEARTAIYLRDQNIIDQQAAAQELGYSSPAGEAPKPAPNPFLPTLGEEEPKEDEKPPKDGEKPKDGKEDEKPPKEDEKQKARKVRVERLLKSASSDYVRRWIEAALHKSGCGCLECKEWNGTPEDPLWAERQASFFALLQQVTARCQVEVWKILKLPTPGAQGGTDKSLGKLAATYSDEQIRRLKEAIQRWIVEGLTEAAPGDMAPLRREYLTTYSAGLYDAAQKTGRGTPLLDIVQRKAAVERIVSNGFELVVSNAKYFRDELLDIISNGVRDGVSAYQIANEMFKAFEDLEGVNWDRLARTEVALAMNGAKREEWKAEGVKKLFYSPNPDACHICVDLRGEYEIDKAPRPVEDTHPNCLCGLELVPEEFKAAAVDVASVMNSAREMVARLGGLMDK